MYNTSTPLSCTPAAVARTLACRAPAPASVWRVAAVVGLACAAALAQAQPAEHRGGHDRSREARGDWRNDHRPDGGTDRREAWREVPGGRQAPTWVDKAHGHQRSYPTPGWSVHALPPHARPIEWSGRPYRFHEGVWYSPGPRGYVVVRPPRGAVVSDLPFFRTVLLVGGLTYLYLNGTYYRERVDGGYEVVDAPPDADRGLAATGAERLFVYPRQGQSPQQQASDEYDCHRWAVTQTGYDPTARAVGRSGGPADARADYQRARGACLEGRGYTVR